MLRSKMEFSESLTLENVASAAGMAATIAFTLQYLPQAILNQQRRSVKGFSTLGIVIKHLGACFLLVNAYLTGEATPVILYGLFNVLQHSVFMVQFSIFPSHSEDSALP